MKKPDKSDRARKKRRQRKIERNRRKRKKTLSRRRKARGHKRNPRLDDPSQILKRVGSRSEQEKAQKNIFDFVSSTLRPRKFEGLRKLIRQNKRRISFPERFSFIEAPDRAIDTLRAIIDACNDGDRKTVCLDQDKCEVIDYGAEAVASTIAKAASEAYGVSFQGKYPDQRELTETVMAAGLPKHLGVKLPSVPHFTPFELHHGRRDSKEWGHKSSEKENIISDFVKYINNCLLEHNYSLTRRGGNHISTLTLEVIDNCEQHAGRDDWWIGGYTRLPEGETYADCHVAIFNFGSTIYETIKEMPSTTEIYKSVKKLVDRHKYKSLFLSEEQLWTLYALQQGVSRFRGDCHEENKDRGQGTVDMIRFFQRLGDTAEEDVSPKMCLLSGNVHILFDGDDDYLMQKDPHKPDSRHTIAFNEDNDLMKPPDTDRVQKLDSYFPGTVISLRFYLDSTYLRRQTKEE